METRLINPTQHEKIVALSNSQAVPQYRPLIPQ